jgi:regulator of protease activity HflC (stomatin/prohibitin superfamily)
VITALIVLLACILAAGLITISTSVRVLREYERGVIFRLGRVMDQKGPGLIFLRPGLDRMVRVSLRTVTLQIPAQEVITRDNVPARVTAVAYYRVIDSTKSVIEIENVLTATEQVAQTTLRSVLGKAELDSLLSERETLNEQLQHIIDDQTEPWGVKVMTVEIKDVEIPERMQHAMARQAEAERERRAKIINAEGEFQAAARLSDAADVISRNPVTIQLRNLQTLIEVSGNQSSTIVFPLPMDVLAPLISGSQNGRREAGESAQLTAATPSPELEQALALARIALEQARTEDQTPQALPEAPQVSAVTEPDAGATDQSEAIKPGG